MFVIFALEVRALIIINSISLLSIVRYFVSNTILRRLITLVSYAGIDNVLTKSLDPLFIGTCIQHDVHVGMCVKSPQCALLCRNLVYRCLCCVCAFSSTLVGFQSRDASMRNIDSHV